MENRRQVGDVHEQQAVEELKQRGYTILQRNFRCRTGEIDIIAGKDGYLVFVEVKYRRSGSAGDAAESVNRRKQAVICRVADYYVMKYYRGEIPACRFDVVAMDGTKVKIYENAFSYIPGGRWK